MLEFSTLLEAKKQLKKRGGTLKNFQSKNVLVDFSLFPTSSWSVPQVKTVLPTTREFSMQDHINSGFTAKKNTEQAQNAVSFTKFFTVFALSSSPLAEKLGHKLQSQNEFLN